MTFFWQNPVLGNPAVTAKRIVEWFPEVNEEDAEVLAAHVRDARRLREIDAALRLFDEEIDAHGIESIRGREYDEVIAYYVNTGDAYTPTLLYDVGNSRFVLTTYGDWLEAYERRHGRVP